MGRAEYVRPRNQLEQLEKTWSSLVSAGLSLSRYYGAAYPHPVDLSAKRIHGEYRQCKRPGNRRYHQWQDLLDALITLTSYKHETNINSNNISSGSQPGVLSEG